MRNANAPLPPPALRDRVAQARTERGWSPEELALRADVSAKQVRRLESGESVNPHLSTLRKIAEATGKDVLWLRPDLEAVEAETNGRLRRIEEALERIEQELSGRKPRKWLRRR